MKTLLNTTVIILAITTSLNLTSCKSDSIDIKLANPSKAGFKELRKNALDKITQKKTFKAEEGLSFTSDKGSQISLAGNCLRDASNNNVTGEVTLNFTEIYDRGSMVVSNKPVMGRDINGDLLPLVTGGQYNIDIEKNGQKLTTGCYFTVKMKASNTGNIDPNMLLWKGFINEEDNLVWEEAARQEGVDKRTNLNIDDVTSNYRITDNTFGWTNVDKFYSDSRPKTQIKVTVPSMYNNENAGVYLSYEGERNLLAQLDIYNTTNKYFTEHYGYIPIGMNIHVIFISEANGSLVYAIKRATIANNATITISDSDLSTGTLAHVTNLINNLN